MKNRVPILTILCFLAACSPKLLPTYKVDSVRVEIREHLIHDTTTFYIEREVEKVVTKDTVSHLETKYAKSDAAVIDGLLNHSLESKPQVVKVPYTVEVHDTTIIEKTGETIIKEVEKPLTKWQSFEIIFGRICGIAIGILLLALIAWTVFKNSLK